MIGALATTGAPAPASALRPMMDKGGLEEKLRQKPKEQPAPAQPSALTPVASSQGRMFHSNNLIADEVRGGKVVEIGPGVPPFPTLELRRLGVEVSAVDNFVPEITVRGSGVLPKSVVAAHFGRGGRMIAVMNTGENIPDNSLPPDFRAELTAARDEMIRRAKAADAQPDEVYIDTQGVLDPQFPNSIDFDPGFRNEFPTHFGDIERLDQPGQDPEAVRAIREADIVRAANLIVPNLPQEKRWAAIERIGSLMKPGARLFVSYTHPYQYPGEEGVIYEKTGRGMVPRSFLVGIGVSRGGVEVLFPAGAFQRPMPNRFYDTFGEIFSNCGFLERIQRIPEEQRARDRWALEQEAVLTFVREAQQKGYPVEYRSGLASFSVDMLIRLGMTDHFPKGLLPPGLEENAGTANVIDDLEQVTGPLARWIESHGQVSWTTNSPRYGTVPARIEEFPFVRQCRFVLYPNEEWANQFPEMAGLLNQVGTFKPGPGAFGQVVVAAYQFTDGPYAGLPCIVIEEVQPGDEYRNLSQSRRQQLDAWRAQLIRFVIELGQQRNLLVFMITADTIRAVYSQIGPSDAQRPLSETEGTVNYTQPTADETVWQDQVVNFVQHSYSAAEGPRVWRAYRGNAAIAERARALLPGTPDAQAVAPLFLPDLQRRRLFLGQLHDYVVRNVQYTGEILNLTPWLSALPSAMCLATDPAAEHSSPAFREMASWVLGRTGRATPPVIEGYRRVLAVPETMEPDPDTRLNMLDDLGSLLPQTADQIDALLGLLEQVAAVHAGTPLGQAAQIELNRSRPVLAVARALYDPASTRAQRLEAANQIANLLSPNPGPQWGNVQGFQGWNAANWDQYATILLGACQEGILAESSRRGDANLQGLLQLVNNAVDLMARQAPPPDPPAPVPPPDPDAVAARQRFNRERAELRGLLINDVRRRLENRQSPPTATISGINTAVARLDAIGLEEFRKPQSPDADYFAANGLERLPSIGGKIWAFNPANNKEEEHWKLERLPPIPIEMFGTVMMCGLTFRFYEKPRDPTMIVPELGPRGPVAIQAPPAGRVWQVYLDGTWHDLDIPFDVDVYVKRGYLDARGEDLEGVVGRPVPDAEFSRVFTGFGDSGTFEYRTVMFWTDRLGIEHRVNLPRQALAWEMSRGYPERTEDRPGWNVSTGTSLPDYPILGHAMIRAGKYVLVHDLGSTNGTSISVKKSYKRARGAANLWSRIARLDLSDPASFSFLADEMEDVPLTGAGGRSQAESRPDQAVTFTYQQPFRVAIVLNNQSRRAVAEFAATDEGMWVMGANGVYEFHGGDFVSPDPFPAAGQDSLGDAASQVEGKGYRVRYDPRTGRVFIVNFSPYRLVVEVVPRPGEIDTDGGRGSKTQGLEEQQLRAAVRADVERIAARLRETAAARERAYFGLGPGKLERHGAEVLDFLNELKQRLEAVDPFLVLVGGSSGAYADHRAVLLTAETPERAAAQLRRLGAGTLQYAATPDEAEQLAAWLEGSGLTLAARDLDSLTDILRQLLAMLGGLPLSSSLSEIDAFYGISLNQLAEQLKALAQIGV